MRAAAKRRAISAEIRNLPTFVVGDDNLNNADAPGQLTLAVASQLAEVSQAPSEGTVECLR